MDNSHNNSYLNKLQQIEQEFESRCKNCGNCCGRNSDPCANLIIKPNGTTFCAAYETRLGPQKTVSGKSFTCVSIRQHIALGALPEGCGYRNDRWGKGPV